MSDLLSSCASKSNLHAVMKPFLSLQGKVRIPFPGSWRKALHRVVVRRSTTSRRGLEWVSEVPILSVANIAGLLTYSIAGLHRVFGIPSVGGEGFLPIERTIRVTRKRRRPVDHCGNRRRDRLQAHEEMRRGPDSQAPLTPPIEPASDFRGLKRIRARSAW